jgi:hypothetical protein
MSMKPPTLPGFNAEAVFHRTDGSWNCFNTALANLSVASELYALNGC